MPVVRSQVIACVTTLTSRPVDVTPIGIAFAEGLQFHTLGVDDMTAFRAKESDDLRLTRRGFWAGWGGWVITTLVAGVVVALLVGWVLLWVDRPGGPSIPLLTLGCVAFTLVLAVLATLLNRVHAHWRLRQMEALLLAGVSHDLRTPISAVRAAAQALDSDLLTAKQQRELVRAIVRESRRLGLRVDNLLETGRWDVERGAVQTEPMDLSSLLPAVLNEAEPTISDLGGSLEADLDQEAYVVGDPRLLRLLVDNLVDNAIHYSQGAPEISVSLRRENGLVVLRIQDSGIGFPKRAAPALFKRFHRGRSRRSGAGLGLALSRAIARGHGGEVALRSNGPGLGAIAELRLPEAGRL